MAERKEKMHGGPKYVIHLRRDFDGSTAYDIGLQSDKKFLRFSLPQPLCLKPSVRHFAIAIPPLPLGLASYEGKTPTNSEFGGEMLVWDQGIYIPFESKSKRTEDYFKEAFEKGKFSIYFESRSGRIRGNFAFTKWDKKGDDVWLVVKHSDKDARKDHEPFPPTSVLSDLTLDEVRKTSPSVTFPSINATFKRPEQLTLLS